MISPDPYDDRGYDEHGEPLCSLPEPSAPVTVRRATAPSFDFSAEAVDICRTAAARHLATEYTHEIGA